MDDIVSGIQSEERRAGIALSNTQRDGLLHYIGLLQKWGKKVNLTANPSPEAIVSRHLPDALYLYRKMAIDMDLQTDSTFVDVGSGAGLPGLLIGILFPELSTTLVESISKKCTFIRTVCHELHLRNVTVVNKRLEQADIQKADLVSSRATWDPEEWLERAGSLLKAGGIAVVFTAGELALEVEPLGYILQSRVKYSLMDGAGRVQTYLIRR